MFFPNGSRYEGEFLKGKKSEHGIIYERRVLILRNSTKTNIKMILAFTIRLMEVGMKQSI